MFRTRLLRSGSRHGHRQQKRNILGSLLPLDVNVGKKHRLYKKSRNSTDPKAKETFKIFKKSVEKDIKHARVDYVNNHVIDGLHQGNTKPFYKYIKSLKNDNIGLAPLTSGADLVTDPHQKAEIMLEEFSSVVTHEDTEATPWLGPAKKKMPNIKVTDRGWSQETTA